MTDSLSSSDDENLKPKAELGIFQAGTYKRYSEVAVAFILFILRTHKQQQEERLYFLKETHLQAIEQFENFLRDFEAAFTSQGFKAIDDVARLAMVSFMAKFYADTFHPPAEINAPSTILHPSMIFTIINTISFKSILAPPTSITQHFAALKWLCKVTIYGVLYFPLSADNSALHTALSKSTQQWLRSSGTSLFAWIYATMGIAVNCESGSSLGMFIWTGEDRFLVDGQSVTILDWIKMIQTLNHDLEARFDGLCSFIGVDAKDLTLPIRLNDTVESRKPGYWFGKDPDNGFDKLAMKFIEDIFHRSTSSFLMPSP